MNNLKKGIAVALAAATAFVCIPVAAPGYAVTAEAAAYSVPVTVPAKGSVTMQRGLGQVYTADANSSGYYVLSASDEAWNAIGVTYTVGNGSLLTASKNNSIYIPNGESFTPTFSDANKGLNGSYTFTLSYIGNGSFSTSVDEVAYTVTLSGSQISGVKAASLSTFRQGSTVLTPTYDQMGGNGVYTLTNGGTYDVAFNAPTYQINGYDQLNGVNTYMNISVAGDSVTYSNNASGNATPYSLSLTAVKAGKTTVTVRWVAADSIGSLVKGTVISEAGFTVNVTDTSNDAVVRYQSGGRTVTAQPVGLAGSNPTITLDSIVNTTADISVSNASSTPVFVSSRDSIAKVDSATGRVTAVSAGTTSIIVYIGDRSYSIPVSVSDVATDRITAQVAGADVDDGENAINLDLSTSASAVAVKSVKLDAASANGLATAMSLYANRTDAAPIAGNANSIASLAADGTITAGSVPGTVYVYISSSTDVSKRINGTARWVKVTVNTRPEATLTANVGEITLDIKSHNSSSLAGVFTTDVTNVTLKYEMTAANSTENSNVAVISANTITAKQVGVGTLVVTVPSTSVTRETKKSIKVNVVSEIAKKVSDLTVPDEQKAIEVKVGETASVAATTSATAAGSIISYESANPAIATVDALGTVTGVAEGKVLVKVTSTETADMQAGSTSFVVIVEKQPEPEPVVVRPKKVTGVKIIGRKKNSKKVTISWDAQSGDGIYYMVEKTPYTRKKVKGKTTWVKGKVVTKKVYDATSTKIKIKKIQKVRVRVRAMIDREVDGEVIESSAPWSQAITSNPKG